jgi:hypothetical protein
MVLTWIYLAGVAAHAQSTVTANVPFQFGVAGQILPRGAYQFSLERDKVLLQDSRGRRIAILLSNAVSGRSVGPTGEVVFECFLRQCFLAEVWSPTEVSGRRLVVSHREKQIDSEKNGTYFAVLGKSKRDR